MIMKKYISLLLVTVMFFTVIPFSAFNVVAETYTDDQGVTYTLSYDGTYYEVTDNETTVTSVIIPAEIDGLPVTSIGAWAFDNCTSLTSVEIPDSVTSIGAYAFYGCTSLISIEIPNSVINIETNPFSGCSSLESITVESGNEYYHSIDNCIIKTATNTLIVGCKNSIIPNSVTSIGNDAFYGCTSLTSIEIPNSVTSIGDWVFTCTSLISINIPNSVTSIGDYAFSNCTSLTSINIPSSVTSIGNWAFYGCSSLESITVESGNEYYHSIDNCIIETATNTLIVGCKNSIIPNSVTSIGNDAFYGCTSLTSIEIPNSVTSIGWYAFCGCTSLTSIEIPNSVTSIGNEAFSHCTSLTDIYCQAESQPEGWDTDWLGDCTATVHWGYSAIVPGGNEPEKNVTDSQGVKYTLVGTYYVIIDCDTSVTSVVIPAEINGIPVSQINQSAFVDCANLTSITIPASITGIGININYGLDSNPFAGCSALETIIIDGNNEYYHVDGNCIIETKTKSLISGFANSIIPSDGSVIVINNGAFESCVDLTSIKIPDNITTIWYYSFSGCTSLTDIYCEAESQPEGWHETWLEGCTATVHWGYGKENEDTSSEPEVPKPEEVIYDIQEDTNIEIEDNGAFDLGTVVSVIKTVHDEIKDKIIVGGKDNHVTIGQFSGTIMDLLFDGTIKNEIFDFTAEKDGVAVQPKVPITVDFKIPEGYSDKVSIYYLSPEGNLEKINSSVDKQKGTVRANLEHFSYYVLIDEGDLEYTLGDINDNGKIDMTDYILLKRAYFGTYKFTEAQNKVGDINKNNKIDMTDYILLKRVYFGTYKL